MKSVLRWSLIFFYIAIIAGSSWAFFSSFPGYNKSLENSTLRELPLEVKIWITRIFGAVMFIVGIPIAIRNIRATWRSNNPFALLPRD